MSMVELKWSVDGDHRERRLGFDTDDFALDAESTDYEIEAAIHGAVDDEFQNNVSYGVEDLEDAVAAVREVLEGRR